MGKPSLRNRVFKVLSEALDQGKFATSGDLCGLDADDLADGLAADFDDRKQGMLWEAGTTAISANEIRPHVIAWLSENVS